MIGGLEMQAEVECVNDMSMATEATMTPETRIHVEWLAEAISHENAALIEPVVEFVRSRKLIGRCSKGIV